MNKMLESEARRIEKMKQELTPCFFCKKEKKQSEMVYIFHPQHQPTAPEGTIPIPVTVSACLHHDGVRKEHLKWAKSLRDSHPLDCICETVV